MFSPKSMYNEVEDMRAKFLELYRLNKFITDKSGVKTLEIVGTTFVADENHIFGLPSEDYIKREIDWYKSMSRDVKDIPGITPKIWEAVADRNGTINSNYGWCIFSPENHNQLDHVEEALKQNPDTRQAIAIYTRPTMHTDATAHGRSDFMCTNTVQYLIRDQKLHAVVNMRSNDVTFGYRNDRAWQLYALEKLCGRLSVKYTGMQIGRIFWQTGSLHIYERDFYLVDAFGQTGKTHISKEEYKKLNHETS